MGQPPQVKHQKPFIINILALAIPLRVVITMITATQKNTGIMNWIVEQVPFGVRLCLPQYLLHTNK